MDGPFEACMEDLIEAESAIQRVRELHKPMEGFGKQWCEHCKSSKRDELPVEYPCPTIKALEGEL